jgi:hypothetical protein
MTILGIYMGRSDQNGTEAISTTGRFDGAASVVVRRLIFRDNRLRLLVALSSGHAQFRGTCK